MRSFKLSDIHAVIGGEMVGNPNLPISGVAGLEEATEKELSFLSNPRYTSLVSKTAAGAVILPKGGPLPPSGNAIFHDNPSAAFQTLINTYKQTLPPQSHFKGISPLAYVAEGAKLEEGVTVAPFAVIEKGAVIGKHSFIGAHSYVGPSAMIGEDCWIHPHVTVREGVIIGNRVILQPGAVIGSCGFGFLPDSEGNYHKLDQLGTVAIGDDVEVGANTTIDRARFAKTDIQAGSKIDNLVQIAHNVKLGKRNIVVSGTGIAGSTESGDDVVFMAKTAVNGHLKIAAKSRFAACSVIAQSVTESGEYGGYPLVPLKTFRRNYIVGTKLADKFAQIEKQIRDLKK